MDQSFDSIYHQRFLELGFKCQDWKSLGVLRHPYPKSSVAILNEIYRILISKNLLMPIEKIPPEEKDQIWEETKPHVKEKSKNDQIRYSKAVYILGEEKKEQTESSKASKNSPDHIQ